MLPKLSNKLANIEQQKLKYKISITKQKITKQKTFQNKKICIFFSLIKFKLRNKTCRKKIPNETKLN